MLVKLSLLGLLCVFGLPTGRCMEGDHLPIGDKYPAMLQNCAIEVGIFDEDISQANDSSILPDSPIMNCLETCIYRELGVIDDDGNLIEGGFEDLGYHTYYGTPGYAAAMAVAERCGPGALTMPTDPNDDCAIGLALATCVYEVNREYNITLSAHMPEANPEEEYYGYY